MKKLLTALILVSFLGLVAAPALVSAAEPPSEISGCTMRHDLTSTAWTDKGFNCPDATNDCEFENTVGYTCGSCCIVDTIYTITDWVFIIVISIAAIMVIIGAFNIITAGGNTEKVTSGRNYIIFAIAGLIVALLAKAIPAIARNMLGM
jgi:hypothetical protein